jgi:hypothetical protein
MNDMQATPQNPDYLDAKSATTLIRQRVLGLYGQLQTKDDEDHKTLCEVFLGHGLEVLEIGPFDYGLLMADGEDYLREYHGENYQNLFGGDRAREFIRNAAAYLIATHDAGPLYSLEFHTPDWAEVEAHLNNGRVIIVFTNNKVDWPSPLLVQKEDAGAATVYPLPGASNEACARAYESVRHLPGGVDLSLGLFAVRRP